MNTKPWLINLFTALVILLAGLYSFLANDKHPVSALIAPGIVAALLLAATPWLKKENKVVAHIVVVLTIIFGVMTFKMALDSGNKPITADFTMDDYQRRIAVFSAMAAACFTATAMYVWGFIEKRRAKKAFQG